jgi:hypothetical protein
VVTTLQVYRLKLELMNLTNTLLDQSIESEQFHSADEDTVEMNETTTVADGFKENRDPNTTTTLNKTKVDEKFDPIARAKEKLANQKAEEAKSKRTESLSGSSTTLTESHVGTFVEHVSGESLRYTARDMEVIRKEARLQAEGSNGDLQQYKVMLSQYEAIFEHIEKKHREEIERKDEEFARVLADRDALQDDMNSMEKTQNELQVRYRRLRTTVEDMRKNEDQYKSTFTQYEQRLKQEQERYRTYKLNSQDVIRQANEELDTIEAKKDQELTKVKAELRLVSLKTKSLEGQLADKKRENEELVQICDQLMGNK